MSLPVALALVLTSTPAEPRQLSPRERAIYRVAVEWQGEAEKERARRRLAEQSLAQARESLAAIPTPEPQGWTTLEVFGAGAVVAVVAASVGLVAGFVAAK